MPPAHFINGLARVDVMDAVEDLRSNEILRMVKVTSTAMGGMDTRLRCLRLFRVAVKAGMS